LNEQLHNEPITIPDNADGRRIYAVLEQIATRHWEEAKAATTEYILDYSPYAETITMYYKNSKCHHIIRHRNGKKEKIIFDFLTKDITVEAIKSKKEKTNDKAKNCRIIA
jgi:hypothetical protein